MTLSNLVRKAALYTAIGATALTGVGMARDASAGEQTVPIGGVHVSGAAGSEWHDQQLLRNPTENVISGDLYCVERSSKNRNNPGFDPANSPSIPVNIAPNSTLIINDAYDQIKETEGACALWLVTDNETNPIWRSRIYNQLVEGQNGMTITASEPSYSPAGFTLSDVLSGDDYRDGLFLESGPDGVEGYWRYKNGAGGNETTIDQDLGPNKTFQWTGAAPQLLGFTPEPGAQLDYVIEAGSANAYLSRTNNDTNDGAWNKFEAAETATQAEYDIELYIQVLDNGNSFSQTTNPGETVIKKVWQVNDVGLYVGQREWTCGNEPDPVVNSLDEIASNYNTRLTWDEQMEFSGDRVGFVPFVNDSDGDGSVCDPDEPDHQYLNLIRLTVTER